MEYKSLHLLACLRSGGPHQLGGVGFDEEYSARLEENLMLYENESKRISVGQILFDTETHLIIKQHDIGSNRVGHFIPKGAIQTIQILNAVDEVWATKTEQEHDQS